MGDVDERDAHFLLQRLQFDLKSLAQLGVEGAERLVKQKHGRVQDEGPGERDPLLLATRQLAGTAFLVSLELHQGERLRHSPPRPGLGHVLVAKPERDILLNREEGEECVGLEDRVDISLVGRSVGDVAPIEDDPSFRGLLEPCYEAQGGGLTAAGRAEQ